MLITKKALDALEELGIREIVLEHTTPLKGRMLHYSDGRNTFVPYGKDENQVAYCIQRK